MMKGSVQSLSSDQILAAYRRMRTIRSFEDRIHIKNQAGEIPGFIHLSAGQEASAVGVCLHLTDDDYITSTHRGHGHALAKGCDVTGMMHEIYAKKTGLCRGKGGSMHMADIKKGMIGANGIVGAGVPLAAGAALKSRVLGIDRVGVSFFGDGAFNQGATLETMNFAKVLNLPMVFVLEDNGYGEATPSSWAVGGEILDRAKGFGLPTRSVNGHDFFAVYDAAGEAIIEARKGQGPSFLYSKLYRYYGHFEGDAAKYRPKGEADRVRKERDCLDLFRKLAIKAKRVTAAQLDEIDRDVTKSIEQAGESALAAPTPMREDLEMDVYASY